MQTTNNQFFQHFIKHNGFKINDNLNEMENFENLVVLLNSNLKGKSKLLKKFNQNIGTNRISHDSTLIKTEEDQPNEFFRHYIRYNGFIYDKNLNKYQNFENLVTHQNCANGRSKLLEKFNIAEKNYVVKKYEMATKFKNELIIIKGINSVKEFFKYFEEKYGFQIKDKLENYLKTFDKLANSIGWKDLLESKKKDFSKMKSYEKKIFIDQNLEFHKLEARPNIGLTEKFIKLSNYLEWKNYYSLFKIEFCKIIGDEVINKFEKLPGLKAIIERYNLVSSSEIPDSINKCKSIIKEKLYVNIFDFINPNNSKKFKDLRSLRSYTLSNRLIFPLTQAKEEFCYKALLRPLLGKRK
jgi:hypothetical protein